MWLIKGRELTIAWNEVLLIAIGGIIRGAIAFGLSLGIETAHAGILKTTV
jgi:NhaP-type Na+/H+ or K+/H+ antiporter